MGSLSFDPLYFICCLPYAEPSRCKLLQFVWYTRLLSLAAPEGLQYGIEGHTGCHLEAAAPRQARKAHWILQVELLLAVAERARGGVHDDLQLLAHLVHEAGQGLHGRCAHRVAAPCTSIAHSGLLPLLQLCSFITGGCQARQKVCAVLFAQQHVLTLALVSCQPRADERQGESDSRHLQTPHGTTC